MLNKFKIDITTAIVRMNIAGRVQNRSPYGSRNIGIHIPAIKMNGEMSCILNLQSLNHGSSNIVVPSGIP